jgi:small subunit ribosomal protein S21
MSKTVNVVITPRKNESPERMIRRFTKKVKKEGILEEVRDRAYYVKPSEKRRKKRLERKRVMRKLQQERDRALQNN